MNTDQHAIATYFTPDALTHLLGEVTDDAARHARTWLLQDGKRLRPMLAAATYAHFGGVDDAVIAPLAVAIECFHKASLIHDDIEDDDALRYNRPTCHATLGIPVAINVGDSLIGSGYRLVAVTPVESSIRAEILLTVTDAHQRLCAGQGDELVARQREASLSAEAVLRLYELKTAAAFESAAVCGALAAGADAKTVDAVRAAACAYGIAFQIQDDLDDGGGLLLPALCGNRKEMTRLRDRYRQAAREFAVFATKA